MLIDVRSPRFELTESILMHVERRVESALGVGRRVVLRVGVTLDDVNATRGGVDKVCRMVVSCRGGVTLVGEARDEDLYVAVDRAAAKVRREVLGEIGRGMRRERWDRQRPGVMAPA